MLLKRLHHSIWCENCSKVRVILINDTPQFSYCFPLFWCWFFTSHMHVRVVWFLLMVQMHMVLPLLNLGNSCVHGTEHKKLLIHAGCFLAQNYDDVNIWRRSSYPPSSKLASFWCRNSSKVRVINDTLEFIFVAILLCSGFNALSPRCMRGAVSPHCSNAHEFRQYFAPCTIYIFPDYPSRLGVQTVFVHVNNYLPYVFLSGGHVSLARPLKMERCGYGMGLSLLLRNRAVLTAYNKFL